MRKLLVICIALCAAIGVVSGAVAGASAPTKKKPPVKLDGDVTNKGTKSVKGGKITIETSDFFFKPTFIKAKAGATVAVTVKNEGSAPHTFTADDGAFDETLQPGDEVTVDVVIPDDGTPLVFHCDFHSGQGMQGAFFVKADSSAGASTPASTSPPGGGNTGY
jgi:plastocyanin